jgi:hypothetical protein
MDTFIKHLVIRLMRMGLGDVLDLLIGIGLIGLSAILWGFTTIFCGILKLARNEPFKPCLTDFEEISDLELEDDYAYLYDE